jgi:hypothetical protein
VVPPPDQKAGMSRRDRIALAVIVGVAFGLRVLRLE